MQLSTNAIILSDLNADGTVLIAEVRVVNGKLPASFITNPGSKYGLPGPTKALSTNLNLQVIMAKKRVPYSRIFPLSETKNNAWKLSGHTLSSVKLELLNKDISSESDAIAPITVYIIITQTQQRHNHKPIGERTSGKR